MHYVPHAGVLTQLGGLPLVEAFGKSAGSDCPSVTNWVSLVLSAIQQTGSRLSVALKAGQSWSAAA